MLDTKSGVLRDEALGLHRADTLKSGIVTK